MRVYAEVEPGSRPFSCKLLTTLNVQLRIRVPPEGTLLNVSEQQERASFFTVIGWSVTRTLRDGGQAWPTKKTDRSLGWFSNFSNRKRVGQAETLHLETFGKSCDSTAG